MHAIHLLSRRKSRDETSSAVDGQLSAGTTSHLASLVSSSASSSSVVSAHMSNLSWQSGILWPVLPQRQHAGVIGALL